MPICPAYAIAVSTADVFAINAALYSTERSTFFTTVESAQRETDHATIVCSVHTTDAITNRTANVGSFRSAIDST